jgi:hypothetical protein
MSINHRRRPALAKILARQRAAKASKGDYRSYKHSNKTHHSSSDADVRPAEARYLDHIRLTLAITSITCLQELKQKNPRKHCETKATGQAHGCVRQCIIWSNAHFLHRTEGA